MSYLNPSYFRFLVFFQFSSSVLIVVLFVLGVFSPLIFKCFSSDISSWPICGVSTQGPYGHGVESWSGWPLWQLPLQLSLCELCHLSVWMAPQEVFPHLVYVSENLAMVVWGQGVVGWAVLKCDVCVCVSFCFHMKSTLYSMLYLKSAI